MNRNLEQLTDYVDGTILDASRSLINEDYQEIFNEWMFCMNSTTKERTTACQREEALEAHSRWFKFLPYEDDLTKKPCLVNIRIAPKSCGLLRGPQYLEIELKLMMFREYANFYLMMLTTLVKTYQGKEKPTTKDDEDYFNKYKRDLEFSALAFQNYAKNAEKHLVYYYTNQCRTRKTFKSIAQTGYRNDKDGAKFRCTCEMPFFGSTKKPCEIARVWVDDDICDAGKEGFEKREYRLNKEYEDPENQIKQYANNKEAVKKLKYWIKEITAHIDTWKSAENYAKSVTMTK